MRGVREFAEEQHISHDEALLKLIETGLTTLRPQPKGIAPVINQVRIPGLTGKPMSDEDAAMMDEVVTEAMEARRHRWERYLRA